MSSLQSKLMAPLGASVALALACFGASAQEPSPAALTYAGQIITDTGMKESLNSAVTNMMGEFEQRVAATRPELREPLHATLVTLAPEFGASEQSLIADAAKALARRMSEDELKATAAFFASPAGKKYLVAQPQAMNDLADEGRAWRENLSSVIVTRSREEMKKKGFAF